MGQIFTDKNKIADKIATELLDGFKERFVSSDYDPNNQQKSWLLWCNLSCKAQPMPTEDIQSLPMNKNKIVYFYSERDKEMYEVLLSEIYDYIDEFEPWEEIDAEIFDASYEWFIAITHEDISLVYGVF